MKWFYPTTKIVGYCSWLLFTSLVFLVVPAQSATTVAPGALLCWGDKAVTYPPPPNRFIQIFAVDDDSGDTFCAISEDNLLMCWGARVPGNSPSASFKQVSISYHACGVKTNDNVVCWGGNGNLFGEINAPAGTFKSVSAGLYYSCAIKTDGTLSVLGDFFR